MDKYVRELRTAVRDGEHWVDIDVFQYQAHVLTYVFLFLYKNYLILLRRLQQSIGKIISIKPWCINT